MFKKINETTAVTIRYPLLLVIILSLFISLCFGQTPYFKAHNIIKGKKNYDCNTTFQAKNGILWFGTNEGLIQFDGINYILFTEKDNLSSNHITALGEDLDGKLWIGHNNGKISIYTNNQFEAFEPEEGNNAVTISAFMFTSDSTVWYATHGEGLCYYKNQRLYMLDDEDGLSDNFVYDICKDSLGTIYASTDQGVNIYYPNTKKIEHISMRDGLPDNIIKSILINKNRLWIGMDIGGIGYIDIKTKKYHAIDNWIFGTVNDIGIAKNTIWAATSRQGIVKIYWDTLTSTYVKKQFNTSHGLINNQTKSIISDREANIWIGCKNGVSQITGSMFEFINQTDEIPFTKVTSVLSDNEGKLWVCSEEGLFVLTKNTNGAFTSHQLFNRTEFEYHQFISLHMDETGAIWAGTYGFGLYRINAKTYEFKNYNQDHGLLNNNIISITGCENKIWCATLGGGVAYATLKEEDIHFKNYSTANGLLSNYVYSTFIDKDNQLWLANDGSGISVVKNDKIHHLNDRLKISMSTIYGFTQDKLGRIWVNTASEGIYCINQDSIVYHLTMQNGLRTLDIRNIAVDQQNNLIVVSNEGFDVFDISAQTFTYNDEDLGVAYKEPTLNAIHKKDNAIFYVGTANGIILYDANIFADQTKTPLIYINNIHVNYNMIDMLAQQAFSYDNNHFTFDFTGIWNRNPTNIRYRYKMKEYDMNWSAPSTSKTVTYSNLPPGSYTFTVQISYDGNHWHECTDSSYSFKISPPFWQTAWFIVGSIVLVSSIVFGAVRWRISQLKEAKITLERMVEERTHKILQQKEEIETQRDHILIQRNEIEEKNKHITASISYAERIQSSMLPDIALFKSYFDDAFIFYLPRDIVSGDFYWFAKCNTDTIYFAASDCTGHGVPGAMMSMIGHARLNESLAHMKTPTPGELLEELHKGIVQALNQQDISCKNVTDGMDIALCDFNTKTKVLRISSAKRPVVLFKNGELIQLKGDKFPVGGTQYDEYRCAYTVHEIIVDEPLTLYLFSDGFADQFDETVQNKYMQKRFKTLLADIHTLPMDVQQKRISDDFYAWKKSAEQTDDVLVMGIRLS